MPAEKQLLDEILTGSGVTINGDRPHDPHVHNPAFYPRVLRQGSLGLGESYMDGWWDCEQLDEFFNRILSLEIDNKVRGNWVAVAPVVLKSMLKTGSRSAAYDIGRHHYDIGNDLYMAMLDRRLTYTCGYWRDTNNLNAAQEAKLDLVCRKIGLRPDQSVLDIGSGWGCFIRFAAERYGARATGITVSREQKKLADRMCELLPAQTVLQDYRDVKGQYDHVVSLGMFEHVGYKRYRTFMQVAHRALKDGGLFLLHTIGGNRSVKGTDAWISKYIFPNSMIPSMSQITTATEGLFVMEDLHNFGADYDRTLMAWAQNFKQNWSKLNSKYDERFYRMWSYYLLSCAGSFRARKNHLWQIVLSKKGVAGGYLPER